MKPRPTIEQYRHLAARNTHLFPEGTKSSPEGKEAGNGREKGQRSKTKPLVALQLTAWCEANGFTLLYECRFHPERRWRFDWFITELKTGIEYEGIASTKSRHTTMEGYSGDTEKYNAATAKGFKIIRITFLSYKSLFTHLEEIKNKQYEIRF